MDWLVSLFNKLFCWLPRIWCVEPNEAGVRITLGKHYRAIGPGWYVYWPIIHVIRTIEVTPQIKDIRPQSVLTHDGQSFCCGGAVKYRIKDAAAALLKVQDYDQTLQALCLGIINRYFTDNDSNDYSGLEDCVLKGVKEAARGWGLDILAVYITDLGPAQNIRILSDGKSVIIPIGEIDG